MFQEILNVIEKEKIITVGEIARKTDLSKEFVRVVLDYWRRKGKISVEQISSRSSTTCDICPLKKYCNKKEVSA
ncbi:MAG: hypothetical protein J7K51_02830 [Thermotogae bacterium]|nr:hypothetical protein [Thermotogota bacterium]